MLANGLDRRWARERVANVAVDENRRAADAALPKPPSSLLANSRRVLCRDVDRNQVNGVVTHRVRCTGAVRRKEVDAT